MSRLTLQSLRESVLAKKSEAEARFEANSKRSNPPPDIESDRRMMEERVANWLAWLARLETAWPNLTRAARVGAQKLVLKNRALSLGYDGGDDLHPSPARQLKQARLGFTWAAGEFDLYGPFVYMSVLLDLDNE